MENPCSQGGGRDTLCMSPLCMSPLPGWQLHTLAMCSVCCSMASCIMALSASLMLSNSSMQHKPPSASTRAPASRLQAPPSFMADTVRPAPAAQAHQAQCAERSPSITLITRTATLSPLVQLPRAGLAGHSCSHGPACMPAACVILPTQALASSLHLLVSTCVPPFLHKHR